ncbi:hypothetical protein G4B88_015663 [Cannabis sativa]|uniref:SPX domain-containing protein n=1 Tax=Cannabis sativa TaxID=3483 RepID=A0A7J6H687_CANSA|nr:hypothetical protein G4B88_015663 [Cannabis sativa]
MKFGKEFTTHLEDTLPEWRDKFLCYKPLKKFLKTFPTNPSDQHQPFEAVAPAALEGFEDQGNPPLAELQDWFIRILNEELDKFNDFYVDKEEEFVIRFQELKERIERVKEKSNNGRAFTSESEFSEEIMDIRRDFVAIHGEMVLLKNYSSLNFAGTGLVKILKKYDKRTGGLLRLPFTQLALRQPSFSTEPLTRLVRECEANLELLFPLEAEIIESTPPLQDKTNQQLNNHANITETPSNLGEDTVYLYRSTIAAMRAIRGLQKASSTYNPLSFSSVFRSQEDEGSGAVTSENSASSTPNTSQNGEED